MNQSWAKFNLKELASLNTGKLDSNAAVADGKYPYFTCAPKTYAIDHYSFNTTAILLAGNNATGVFPIKFFSGKFNCYQRTYVIESINPEECDLKFLYFSLQVQLKFLQNLSIGAATKFLTKRLLDNLKIRLPPLPTQQKIAQILSAYDDLIENNLKRIKLLEEMAQITYEQWFVRMKFPNHETTPIDTETGLPEGWVHKRLGQIITLNYGKALKADDRKVGSIPVYGSAGIVGCHNKRLVDGPGVIVGRKGNVGSVFWADKGFFPIDTVYYVVSSLSLHFIFYLIKYIEFINNDAAVPGLNRNAAYMSKVKLPSEELIKQFSKKTDTLFQNIEVLNKQNHLLKEARDILLPRLMTGMIDVDKIKLPKPLDKNADSASTNTKEAIPSE